MQRPTPRPLSRWDVLAITAALALCFAVLLWGTRMLADMYPAPFVERVVYAKPPR